jgi:hypothetical protein
MPISPNVDYEALGALRTELGLSEEKPDSLGDKSVAELIMGFANAFESLIPDDWKERIDEQGAYKTQAVHGNSRTRLIISNNVPTSERRGGRAAVRGTRPIGRTLQIQAARNLQTVSFATATLGSFPMRADINQRVRGRGQDIISPLFPALLGLENIMVFEPTGAAPREGTRSNRFAYSREITDGNRPHARQWRAALGVGVLILESAKAQNRIFRPVSAE